MNINIDHKLAVADTKMDYADRIEAAKHILNEADAILLGGGAGLSDAAGLKFSGERFIKYFAPFIEKYGMEDMYTSSFYPFETEEEKWAYWAQHVVVNRYLPSATRLYADLFSLVEGHDYFVLTTNVDYQFYKADFDDAKIFAIQGDYGKMQCATGCHNQLYDNELLMNQMVVQTKGCKIPTELVPHCPICDGEMSINVRKDSFFVEDNHWMNARNQYYSFLETVQEKHVVLLELGVGYNTPGIIRYPFEKMVFQNSNIKLIRMNTFEPQGWKENAGKTISFTEDISNTMTELLVDRHA